MRPEVRVVEDVAAAAAQRIVATAEAGGHIALSGGSTPKAAYGIAAGSGADWSRAVLWFGDDRAVPPDHEHSNYRMAREALLDRIEGAEVHPIRGELGAHAAADDYERQLREAFGGELPVLDLALLGLGPDGHTASLFPGKPAVEERERLAVAVEEAGMEPYVPRVTLTLPVFNAAREVVFLVAGADKAGAVMRAFGGNPDPATPASLIDPAGGRLVLLCDAAAASILEGAPA